MIAPLIFASEPADAKQFTNDVVYACQYMRDNDQLSDGWVHQVDMRVVRRADRSWKLEREAGKAISAEPFETRLGNVGGSVGLRWKDVKGAEKTAYVAFSDAVINDVRTLWLSFDKPSRWQAPGFFCQSQPSDAKANL